MPTLRHEEAVRYLVEYHFGRLSPQLNAAVEAHIRECKVCQRQGLTHAATERREVARKLRRVRPSKQRISGRGRGVIFFLVVVVVLQVAIVEISRGSLFSTHPAVSASPTATVAPTPVALTASLTYPSSSGNATALALSPDGGTLATASLNGSTAVVTLWNTASGKAGATLTWPGQTAPGVLEWSPDGKHVAAADGALIGVWALPTATPAWTLTLPSGPALRVYDTQAGALVPLTGSGPDASSAFYGGSRLSWSTGGILSYVKPDGATSPVTASGEQVIDLWRAEGSHMFADGKGGTLVGVSSADAGRRPAVLSWSPDGHYLLWASVNRLVAVPAPQHSGTPATSATSTAASTEAVPVPNAIAGALAGNVATSGHGDVLMWFSADGRYLAACDRSEAASPLDVYDIPAGRVVSQLAGACTNLTTVSLAWQRSPSALILAVPGKPIAAYPIVAGGG